MNVTEILSLSPGTPLDNAINTFVFAGKNPDDKFSTSDEAASKILDRISLFVGRVEDGPKFSSSRPWVAGRLAWENSINGYVTRLSVSAPTRQSALCKAALLVVFAPAVATRQASAEAAPELTSQRAVDQARALAARVGTKRARKPNLPEPQPSAPTRAVKSPVAQQGGARAVPQPRAFSRQPLAPMPARKPFVQPDAQKPKP